MTPRRACLSPWAAGLALAAMLAPPPALARPHICAKEARAEARRETRQLTRFEATLAAQPSATKALEQWCGTLTGTGKETIRASPVTGADAPLPRDARSLLGVASPEPLGYRHVRLSCSAGTLSEAHNWYVPARLTPEMNATLATTETPFGKVVAPLHFTREPLASQPLPTHRTRGPGCPAHTILTHRALLRLPDGAPLALVVECYSVLNLIPAPLPAPPPPPEPGRTAPQPAPPFPIPIPHTTLRS